MKGGDIRAKQGLTDAEQRAFDLVVTAALRGERCPTGSYLTSLKFGNGILSRVARKGFARVEVWPHNWRVVEIMKDPYRGCRTLESPIATEPYRVIEAEFSAETGDEAGDGVDRASAALAEVGYARRRAFKMPRKCPRRDEICRDPLCGELGCELDMTQDVKGFQGVRGG